MTKIERTQKQLPLLAKTQSFNKINSRHNTYIYIQLQLQKQISKERTFQGLIGFFLCTWSKSNGAT